MDFFFKCNQRGIKFDLLTESEIPVWNVKTHSLLLSGDVMLQINVTLKEYQIRWHFTPFKQKVRVW